MNIYIYKSLIFPLISGVLYLVTIPVREENEVKYSVYYKLPKPLTKHEQKKYNMSFLTYLQENHVDLLWYMG